MPPYTISRSIPVLLALAFTTLYFAMGPGRFFSVDEVIVEAAARAVYSRRTLEVPAIDTTVPGREGAFYAGHRGPALTYAVVPLVVLGDILDNRFGSFNGGTAAGPPLGTLEHPLRWGGRLSIFVVLAANALFAGCAVSMLYLISHAMSGNHAVSLLVSSSAGAATLLFSEATHFFQHPLEAVLLLTGFWFLISPQQLPLRQQAWLGGLSLGLAVLARPSAAPAAAMIWLFGAAKVWTQAHPPGALQLRQFIPRAAAAPIVCAALYLVHNHRQFGDVFQFSAREPAFEVSVEALKAAAAYLVSPGLSVFLFAIPLVLVPFHIRAALRRWPWETGCVLLTCLAHSLVIFFFRWWDGSLSYGPRYMLAPILLLMLLTVPAFELAVRHRSLSWRLAVTASVILGVVIQVIGVAVYVVVNEWHHNQYNIAENGAFVFIPSASPVWIQLQELIAGRNITMWAVRAISERDAALVLFFVTLIVVSAFSFYLAAKSRNTAASRIPAALTNGVAALVLAGFVWTTPVTVPSGTRTVDLVNAGLEAQEAGFSVKAQELYAIVLGLEPSNKYAMHNLAILYEEAGKTDEAVALYERTLASDPDFAPSVQNLALYHANGAGELHGDNCPTPEDCYRLGEALSTSGDVAGALRVWERASQRFPLEVWLIRDVAWSRYQLGDYAGAVQDYTTAASLSPADIEIRIGLAWALLRAERFSEARRICTDLLQDDPANTAAKAILTELGAR